MQEQLRVNQIHKNITLTTCVYAVGKCLLHAVNTEVGALSAMYSYSLNCLLVSDEYCEISSVTQTLSIHNCIYCHWYLGVRNNSISINFKIVIFSIVVSTFLLQQTRKFQGA